MCVWLQALNKKEHKGCESPDPVEPDPYAVGLRPEDKYDRLPPEDYQRAMQQNAGIRGVGSGCLSCLSCLVCLVCLVLCTFTLV